MSYTFAFPDFPLPRFIDLDPTTIRRFALIGWFALVAALALFEFVLPHGCKYRTRGPRRAISALAFLCLVAVLDGVKSLGLAIVPLLLIVFLHGKLVKDCPACGAVVRNANPFSAANYCPSCGTSLHPRDLRARFR